MVDRGSAPDQQLTLPFAQQRGEASVGAPGESTPVSDERLMERVVERHNRLTALARVKANGGSSGIDGMTVEEWPAYLRQHWLTLRASLLAGAYHPSPVMRVEIPKPSGGVRKLGSPMVRDRLLQQALLHVLHPAWDKTFSGGSTWSEIVRGAWTQAHDCGSLSYGCGSPSRFSRRIFPASPHADRSPGRALLARPCGRRQSPDARGTARTITDHASDRRTIRE